MGDCQHPRGQCFTDSKGRYACGACGDVMWEEKEPAELHEEWMDPARWDSLREAVEIQGNVIEKTGTMMLNAPPEKPDAECTEEELAAKRARARAAREQAWASQEGAETPLEKFARVWS